MNPGHRSRFTIRALLTLGVATNLHAAEQADDSEPCAPDVAAYVASGGDRCRGGDSSSPSAALTALVIGQALRAGYEIECAPGATVTITFCTSRQDKEILGRENFRYIVANVPVRDATQNKQQISGALRIAQNDPQIPVCEKSLGTLVVLESENKWWVAHGLESPAALIGVFVTQSKCFTLVERDKRLANAQVERALASSGERRGGSNIGNGQMKAADYVLLPDVADLNKAGLGGSLGGLLGNQAIGGIAGGVNLKRDVTLTLTDVRSTEQIAIAQGQAKKQDLGGGTGNGLPGGLEAGGAGAYANTEIGQIVAKAYLDSFVKLVNDVKALDLKPYDLRQSVTMTQAGRMHERPSLEAKVVRTLDAGTTLHASGEKEGPWSKVTDDLGNQGWVSSALLRPAK